MKGAGIIILCAIALVHGKAVKSGITDANLAICLAADTEGLLIPHERCNRFINCNGGLPVVMKCPLNLLYNIEMEYCDYAYNVECGDRVIIDDTEEESSEENNVTINDDPSQAPAICAAEDSNGVLVAHENCHQFYSCFDNIPYVLTCPTHFLYNPEKLYCDWPENVDCGNRVIPEWDDDDVQGGGNDNNESEENIIHGHDDPSQAPAICAAANSEGVLVAHEECNHFYKCNGGKPVSLICPAGLLYNPPKEWCDWPINVTCGDRILN